MFTSAQEFRNRLNEWGDAGIPFVFMIDYAKSQPMAWTTEALDAPTIAFDFNGYSNGSILPKRHIFEKFSFHKAPISFEQYKQKFDLVMRHLNAGNSFLVNLSVPTPIDTNLTLHDIFERAHAPYRLRYKDEWVCFSPEIFVRIKDHEIGSYPMKGTIDAAIPNAAEKILNDPKESAEHATIVDLIRNDLSMVCNKVWVERYRYLEPVQTHQKTLLQVSSEVRGTLAPTFQNRFGDLLWELLPAGSITGAPKPSTMAIIEEAEGYQRGYYTGVMGYYDGVQFESAVMIRFIEKGPDGLLFKSGGGITAQSVAESEYQEMIDKVYFPFENVQPSIV
ncbi:para-aminobenzoate synthetase component 1 [Dyadobacter jejuensis]|uniref:Para-aminobenzoate synthetase component 1 n=1 Tax=Dyadobacter jejuensis TaxID=1082580 RepID=A0A316AIN2_9BACT|nr:aminodeoxychorismate synthase component I [Dyadobacter jejuensis]PWJ57645.1 para-aminobenzoate synthetase component 1 [Dyadobacter jejuensis]